MVITTPRLKIKKLRLEDAYRLYAYRSKKEVEQFQSFHNFSLEDARKVITKKEEGIEQLGIYLNDVLIGDLYFNVNRNNECFIGYTLDSDYWHQGYAYEAVWASLLYFNKHQKIHHFYAYIVPLNIASIQLIKKLGFIYIGNQIYYLYV